MSLFILRKVFNTFVESICEIGHNINCYISKRNNAESDVGLNILWNYQEDHYEVWSDKFVIRHLFLADTGFTFPQIAVSGLSFASPRYSCLREGKSCISQTNAK